jgi:hypothetical protein
MKTFNLQSLFSQTRIIVFTCADHSMMQDNAMIKSSPKRRKGAEGEPLVVDTGADNRSSIFKSKNHRTLASTSDRSIDGAESNRFGQLSMNDNHSKRGETSTSLFLSLSTSPINHPEVDATPISKNTKKKIAGVEMKIEGDTRKPSPISKLALGRPAETPTPPIQGMGESEMMTDEQMLNTHLRGQSFTPLPHLSESSGISPSNMAFSALAPQLSWSIAGDTPSLEDLATCSWEETEKDEKKRPGSTTSQSSNPMRGLVISPHSFMLWKEVHESNHPKKVEEGKDGESMHFSILSPPSESGRAADGIGGTTTPLPLYFDQPGSEERENVKQKGERENFKQKDNSSEENGKQPKEQSKEGDSEHIHQMFVSNGGRGAHFNPTQTNAHFWSKPEFDGALGPPRECFPPTPVFAGSQPPTPLFAGSHMGFARSPMHGERRDHHFMFGHPGGPGPHDDRVRNLRG